MILCSEQELRRQICRQRIAAELSFAASLLAVLSGGTLILFLFIHDSICIPANARNVSGAEKFIDFLCEPDVAAQNAEGAPGADPSAGDTVL